MKNKILWMMFISLIVLALAYCASIWSIKRSKTDNLQELPRFGKFLPYIGKQNIFYEYNPRCNFLDAKFVCDTNIFSHICVTKNLSLLRYVSGFDKNALLTENPIFMPEGSHVWCAWGMLNPPSRFTLHLFFEPPNPNNSNSDGIMFLHVR